MANDAINPDVKLAFEAIKNKRVLYDLLYSYYKGNHPLRYSMERLKKAFEKITYFAQNWVAVIVDSMLDRLSLKGFDVSGNDTADKRLDELWKLYNLQLIADDVHEASIITGEAFIIAMKAEEEDDEDLPLDIYFNDPRMCHVFYESDKPAKKRFAAKLWTDHDKYLCLTLYYKDRIEYYRSRSKAKKNESSITSWTSFRPDPDLPEEDNQMGVIPVFHFSTGRVSKKKDLGASEISLQDAINKLFADMMVSAEFQSFRQRVIISQADPGELQNSPSMNWWIPAGDDKGQPTSVQELGGGQVLDGFLNAIDKIATSLAIISRTPKHYFFMTGGDPSGEALITMEAPLTKKVKKRQAVLGVEWQNFAAFLLKLDGNNDIKKSDITLSWEPIETILPSASASTTQTEINSGIPLVTSLRRKGWSTQDIKQLIDDMNDKTIQTSEQSLKAEKLLWEAAQAAINAGIPLEVFLENQGWTPEQLKEFGEKKLAAIKLKQEDIIPPTTQ